MGRRVGESCRMLTLGLAPPLIRLPTRSWSHTAALARELLRCLPRCSTRVAWGSASGWIVSHAHSEPCAALALGSRTAERARPPRRPLTERSFPCAPRKTRGLYWQAGGGVQRHACVCCSPP